MRKELVELKSEIAFMKAIAVEEGSNKLKREINNLLRNLKVILNDGNEEELELLKSFLFDYDANEDNTGRYKIPLNNYSLKEIEEAENTLNNLLKSGKTITTKQYKESFVSFGTKPDKIDTTDELTSIKDTFNSIFKIVQEIKAGNSKYFESTRKQINEFSETFGDDNMKECTRLSYKEILDLIDIVENSTKNPLLQNKFMLFIYCIENIKNKLSKFEEEFYKTI